MGISIPVVDLATVEKLEQQQRQLLKAGRELGCFRVINHGIPSLLQSEMKSAVRTLFDLPADVKLRNSHVIHGSGYVSPTEKNPLYEAFGLYNAASPADVTSFCSCLDAPPRIRDTIQEYATKLHEVIMGIASRLAESMGLAGCSFKEWPCQFRINKYHFTEETIGSSGVQIHTDSGFLTLLQEDDSVGGLELMDPASGSFVPVDPVPGSLLVNLGDVAKAWSNGVLHNVKHRVVCKEAATRISIALFLLAPEDDKVEAPAVFVGQDHPRLYRSFNYDDYRKLRQSTGLHAGEALSQLLLSA